MSSRNHTAARPLLACEVFADRVLAGRASKGRELVEAHTSRRLAPGAVQPALNAANLQDGPALAAALAEALGTVAGRAREVIAIVPDAAARVVLLEFDSLPANSHEAAGVVRFRLKKALPFDVEKARLAFHSSRSGQGVRVVATVMLKSVLEEYEAAFAQAGYHAGIVLPSTLAALGAVEGSQPTLLLKATPRALTIAIVAENELRFFRSLELEAAQAGPERLVEEVHPALVFYQDHFGAAIERMAVAGSLSARELAPAFSPVAGFGIEDLVAERYVGGALGTGASSGALAGIVGALVG